MIHHAATRFVTRASGARRFGARNRMAGALAAAALMVSACVTPAALSPDPQLAHAGEIAGFGGLFIDENGAPVVYLTDPRRLPDAAQALAPVLETRGFAPADLLVLRARHDYGRLHEWFVLATHAAFQAPDVSFVDLDESRQRIFVGVAGPEDARLGVEQLLAGLSIPADALAVESVEPFAPLIGTLDQVRPVIGGTRVEGGLFCSLGFNVSRTDIGRLTGGRPSVRDNRPSFITNSHCTNVAGGEEGTQFGQPELSDPIGTEIDDPDYWSVGPYCPSGELCRYSDSARVRYTPGVDFALGAIARPTRADPVQGPLEISGVFAIVAEQPDPIQGERLNKVGAITGWTFGRVTGTCVHARNTAIDRIFVCQGVVEAGAAGGDSGAPVFSVNAGGDGVTLHGVLWGGSGTQFIYSPMSAIERDLGRLTTLEEAPAPTGRGADLVPEPLPGAPGAQGFCRRAASGDLIVRIRNQSNIDVLAATTTRVAFSRGGAISQSTPPIAGGSFADVAFAIPAACRSTDCGFTISADAELQVDERQSGTSVDGEANNTAEGVCFN